MSASRATVGDVAAEAAAENDRPTLMPGRLGRDTAIYAAGVVLARIVSFLMLPLYTRLLTPADYGLIQMLELTLEIAAILLSAGTTIGLMRFYFKRTDARGRHALTFTAALLLLSLNLVGSLLLVETAPLILQHVLGGAGSLGLIYIAAANFTLGALPVVPLLLMQIEQSPWLFFIASTAKMVLQFSLNLLFLVGFHWGPRGILTSTLLTNLLVGTALMLWMIRRTGFRVSWESCKDLQRFGMPHQVASAAMFILAYGDRFLLQKAHGLYAVGLYSLAYQFGMLLSNLGSASFIPAWTPLRYQLLSHERPERDAKYNEGLDYLSLVIVTLFVGISLFSRPLLTSMSSPAYHSAADIVPVIALCYVIHGWIFAVHFGIDVSEQTKYAAYANWIAAGVIVIAYVLLIPPFGGLGAGIATLIGFIVRFLLVNYWANKLFPIHYRWGRSLRVTAVALSVVWVPYLVRPTELVPQLVLALSLTLVYAGIVWMLCLDAAHKEQIRQVASRLRRWSLQLERTSAS